MNGIELIAQERHDQLLKHGYDSAHDREHEGGELADAAVYCMFPNLVAWPFALSASPVIKGYSEIHRLKVAGALIAAEIDRLLASGETCTEGKPA